MRVRAHRFALRSLYQIATRCYPSHHECETHHPDIERIRHRCELRMVRNVGLEEVLGVGNASDFCGGRSGECEIFFARVAKGVARGANTATFGPGGDEQADKGVWMSVWWTTLTHPQAVCGRRAGRHVPTDRYAVGVREMHVRHPDGHVFRSARARHAWVRIRLKHLLPRQSLADQRSSRDEAVAIKKGQSREKARVPENGDIPV